MPLGREDVMPPVEVVLDRPGIMPETVPPMLPAVSLTCSTTRLITLRAGALRAATAAPVAAAPTAAPTAARLATFLTVRFLAEAFPAFLAAAERLVERAFDAFDAFDAFLLPARFFELFFEERLEERLLDERFFEPPDERFFEEDFFDDFLDFRDEPFREAAIWFLLLTVLDWGA